MKMTMSDYEALFVQYSAATPSRRLTEFAPHHARAARGVPAVSAPGYVVGQPHDAPLGNLKHSFRVDAVDEGDGSGVRKQVGANRRCRRCERELTARDDRRRHRLRRTLRHRVVIIPVIFSMVAVEHRARERDARPALAPCFVSWMLRQQRSSARFQMTATRTRHASGRGRRGQRRDRRHLTARERVVACCY